MRRDIIRFTRPLQHEQLWEDGNGLQPDAERPQHFGNLVSVREKDAEGGSARKKVLNFEGVDCGIVCGFIIVDHKVDYVGLGGEEEDFEGGVP